MAKTKISEFSATPGNNTDIDGINIAEGCAPSGINNAIRELMSQLKDWQAGTSNDPMTIGSSGSLTLSYGTANGVAYLNGSKVLTTGSALTFDGTNLAVANRLGLGGVTSPTYALDVGDSASGNMFRFSRSGTELGSFISGGTPFFGTLSNHPLAFMVNSTEQMRLTSTGLGIGTSSPTAKLSVIGPDQATGNINTASNIDLEVSSTGSSGSSGGSLVFSANSGSFKFAAIKGLVQDGSGNSRGDLCFSTRRSTSDSTLTESMRLDFAGNLGLGVTPSAWSGTNTKALDISLWTSLANGNAFGSAFTFNGFYNGTNWIYKQTNTASKYEHDGSHRWFTAPSGTAGNAISFTQAMTLTAGGDLLVGATTANVFGIPSIQAGGSNANGLISVRRDTTTASDQVIFYNPNGLVGRIQTTGSATAYVTSSDYRLKENIQPMTGALEKVAALKPVTYTWKADGSDGQGFIAHELQAVCPDAVIGEKDAVDADGKPQYQGIDVSFLVGTLTAAIQELKAEFDAYKASHP